jgi:hypothetical protein
LTFVSIRWTFDRIVRHHDTHEVAEGGKSDGAGLADVPHEDQQPIAVVGFEGVAGSIGIDVLVGGLSPISLRPAQETTDCLALVETTLLIEGLGMTTTTAAVAATFVSVSLRSRGRRAARLPVIGDRASIPEKTGLLPVEFLTMITGATRRAVVLAPCHQARAGHLRGGLRRARCRWHQGERSTRTEVEIPIAHLAEG